MTSDLDSSVPTKCTLIADKTGCVWTNSFFFEIITYFHLVHHFFWGFPANFLALQSCITVFWDSDETYFLRIVIKNNLSTVSETSSEKMELQICYSKLTCSLSLLFCHFGSTFCFFPIKRLIFWTIQNSQKDFYTYFYCSF